MSRRLSASAALRRQAGHRQSSFAPAAVSGKTGYVSIDSIAPIGNDQLCYVMDGGAWKIGGYIGGDEPQ